MSQEQTMKPASGMRESPLAGELQDGPYKGNKGKRRLPDMTGECFKTTPSLMTWEQLAEHCRREEQKYWALAEDTLSRDRLAGLLSRVRSQTDGKEVRSYLTVIGEYTDLLVRSPKDVVLSFLYDMLSHRDSDVRRQAAAAAGKLLAEADGEDWRTFLHRCLFPDRALPQQQRRWIGYAMKNVLRELLKQTQGQKRREVLQIYAEFYKSARWDTLTCFFLLEGMKEISMAWCNDTQRRMFLEFALHFLHSEDEECRVSALYIFAIIIDTPDISFENDPAAMNELAALRADPARDSICVCYLTEKIQAFLSGCPMKSMDVREDWLYLENQRAEVPWVCKRVYLRMLREHFIGTGCSAGNEGDSGKAGTSGKVGDSGKAGALAGRAEASDRAREASDHAREAAGYAYHLLHMLQYTDRAVSRLQAGRDLTAVTLVLEDGQKKEIVLELLNALERADDSAARYIPACLGGIFPLLRYREQASALDALLQIAESGKEQPVLFAMEASGKMLQGLLGQEDAAQDREGQVGGTAPGTQAEREEVIRKLCGILCLGSAHWKSAVSRMAFYQFAGGILGNSRISEKDREFCFAVAGRRMFCYSHEDGSELSVLYRAASLQAVVRFLDTAVLPREEQRPEVFFLREFDPFTLGHKEIARELAASGYDVHIAMDEFDWRKKTLPCRLRYRMAAMSVAEMEHVYLFPLEVPINLANPEDRRLLKEMFGGRKVIIAAGSDTVETGEAYQEADSAEGKGEPGRGKETALCEWDHLVYLKGYDGVSAAGGIGADVQDEENIRDRVRDRLKGRVQFLRLPPWITRMTSASLREKIAAGRETEGLVVPGVREFICDMDLYVREPVYKKIARIRDLRVEKIGGKTLVGRRPENPVLLTIGEDGKCRCAIEYRTEGDTVWILRAQCFSDAGDNAQQDAHPGGGHPGTGGKADFGGEALAEALNELLADCHSAGFRRARAFASDESAGGLSGEALRMEGFLPAEEESGLFEVSLEAPSVVFYDSAASFKEPYALAGEVRQAVWEAHRRFCLQAAALYPGQLLLSFDSEVLNSRLCRLIAQSDTSQGRLCVPFGKILRGVLIPGMVTKELSTEKVYDADLACFEIREFPGNKSLSAQIRTIRSFGKEVVLTDDLLHNGYRFKAVAPYFARGQVPVARLVAGVLSGRGARVAKEEHLEVSAVYSLPGLRCWMIESDMYPLIGGDGVDNGETEEQLLTSLPSVNPILPYQMPPFLKNVPGDVIYQFSQVCLENAMQIWGAVEKTYAGMYQKRLTADRMREVLFQPRYPDSMAFTQLSRTTEPSALIRKELEKLRRFRSWFLSSGSHDLHSPSASDRPEEPDAAK